MSRGFGAGLFPLHSPLLRESSFCSSINVSVESLLFSVRRKIFAPISHAKEADNLNYSFAQRTALCKSKEAVIILTSVLSENRFRKKEKKNFCGILYSPSARGREWFTLLSYQYYTKYKCIKPVLHPFSYDIYVEGCVAHCIVLIDNKNTVPE